MKDASKELLNLKPVNLKRLGIDEIALTKGKGNYCAVLIDLDTSKLITINGRTQNVVKEILLEWGNEILEKIEEVSIDLWQGYKNLVTELMPKAQVVADRFHIMVEINKELDAQRKKEKRVVEESIKKAKTFFDKTENEKVLSGLNKSKYVLLKNESDLKESQINKLIQVKTVSPTLKAMHKLKEKLRTIFQKTENWYPAVFKLGMWLSKAKTYFPNVNNTFILKTNTRECNSPAACEGRISKSFFKSLISRLISRSLNYLVSKRTVHRCAGEQAASPKGYAQNIRRALKRNYKLSIKLAKNFVT